MLGACGNNTDTDSESSEEVSSEQVESVSEGVEADTQSSVSSSQAVSKDIQIALGTKESIDFSLNEYTTQADEDNYMNLAGYTKEPSTVYVIYEDTVIDTVETDDDNAFLYRTKTNKTDTTIYLTTDDSLNIGTIDSVSELEDEPVKVNISPNEAYLASKSSSTSVEESKESIKKVDLDNARTDLTYDDLMRYSDDNYGELVELSGTVLQTMQGDGEIQHRVALNDDYDTVVLIGYEPGTASIKILEDDYITFIGTSVGTTTYETVMGAEIEIPAVYVEEININ
ncbi:hypothetical protein FPV23_03650 [Carnobacterium sp. PL17RED31]|nr:hypothetical protein FPV23_03650 [Carnobacterium sp. PL17RED31]